MNRIDQTNYELEKDGVIQNEEYKCLEENYSKHLENQHDYYYGNPPMEGDNTKTFARMWDEEI